MTYNRAVHLSGAPIGPVRESKQIVVATHPPNYEHGGIWLEMPNHLGRVSRVVTSPERKVEGQKFELMTPQRVNLLTGLDLRVYDGNGIVSVEISHPESFIVSPLEVRVAASSTKNAISRKRIYIPQEHADTIDELREWVERLLSFADIFRRREFVAKYGQYLMIEPVKADGNPYAVRIYPTPPRS